MVGWVDRFSELLVFDGVAFAFGAALVTLTLTGVAVLR